ncbi:MAG TPA: hypothetical protein ENI04_01450 [Candidatus Wildermuthbacteria bacterium]|nr:hypothetical protein [Candidatus Wildermuthbacteria bacterium]
MRRLIFIFLAIAIVALVVPGISSAVIELNLDYPKFGGVDLNCRGDADAPQCGQDLTSLIAWLYYGIIMLSGLAAFVMIVWGGIQYLTSSGDTVKTGDAKDRMQKALLGLLIILSSWLILQTINPELTILEMPGRKDTSTQPPVAPMGLTSGGAPPAKICFGEDLKESSEFTLKDTAKFLCESNNDEMPERENRTINAYLWGRVGGDGKKCSSADVQRVHNFLVYGFEGWERCGEGSGGPIDDIVIDGTTVPASLCNFTQGDSSSGGIAGIIYSGRVDSGIFYLNIFGLSNSEILEKVQTNTAALVEYCQGRTDPFCSLEDGTKTRIDAFNPVREDALAQYCFDILKEHL